MKARQPPGNSYWIERAERVLTQAERKGEEAVKQIDSLYETAMNTMRDEVDRFYGRYAKKTGLSLDEVKKLLAGSDYTTYKQDLKLYYDEAARLGLDPEYKGYLRMLSGKSYISKISALGQKIRHSVEVLKTSANDSIAETLKSAYQESYYLTNYDMSAGMGVQLNFNRLDDAMLDGLVKKPWLGDNYSDRLWENKANLLLQMDKIIPQAFVLGKGSRELGDMLAERMGVSKNAAHRLVQTEINHANNEAAFKSYEDAGIESYQFIATLDNRTSSICKAMDNKIIPLKNKMVGVNYPPLHPYCRSTTIPYFEPDEIDAKFGHLSGFDKELTYKEWREKNLPNGP